MCVGCVWTTVKLVELYTRCGRIVSFWWRINKVIKVIVWRLWRLCRKNVHTMDTKRTKNVEILSNESDWNGKDVGGCLRQPIISMFFELHSYLA